jgi:hypothetical protein
MTKQEILNIEAANADRINLFHEGSFWIAYERSAFRFVHSVRRYKVSKKWIKSANAWIASLGFPVSALDGIVAAENLEIVEQTENNRIVLRAPQELPEGEFERWKAELEVFTPKTKLPQQQPELNVNENAYEVKPATENATAPDLSAGVAIVHRVMNFSIESSTPMECMFFLADLKKLIREQLIPNRGGNHEVRRTAGLQSGLRSDP